MTGDIGESMIPSHSAAQCENNLKSEIFNTSKQRITNTHINDPHCSTKNSSFEYFNSLRHV